MPVLTLLPLVALLSCAPTDAPRASLSRSVVSKSRTLLVDCTGAAEYTDIVSAVEEADSGDTIEVAPCTYEGSVDFRGREVHIVATGGPEVTFIVATEGEPVVEAHRGEGPNTILEGFTLVGGGGAERAAVEDEFSALTLRDVVITGSAGFVTVYARSSFLRLENVWIDETNTPALGMQVQARRGALVVKDSRVTCGAAGVGVQVEHGAGFLDGLATDCAGEEGVHLENSPSRVQRSVFTGRFTVVNEDRTEEAAVMEGNVFLGGLSVSVSAAELHNAVFSGAGIVSSASTVTVAGAIFTGAACALESSGAGSLRVEYSAFHGNGENHCSATDPVGSAGNIEADPSFTDLAAGDYTLRAGSSAIDAGSPADSYRDVDGSRNDIGAWGGPFQLGGGW